MSETNDVYELSDDAFAQMDLSAFDDAVEEETVTEEGNQETPEDTVEDAEDESVDDDTANEDEAEDTEDNQETEENLEEDTESKSDEEVLNDNGETDKKVEANQEETKEDDTSNKTDDIADVPTKSDDKEEVSAEAFFAKVTAPFKANGKEFSIKNADDAIALMQQGINYSKNMAELKPDKALLKTLKEHKLTNPDDISYLIDLHNKDPKAIAKLIKESNINLYEFDTEIADGYAPSKKVNEPTKLDDVVESLNANPSFNDVLGDVVDNWDTESKRFITSNPDILRVMTEQKQSGLYDKIVSKVEYDRTVGKLEGVSNIEAYTRAEQELLAKEKPASQEEPKAKTTFKAPRPAANKTTDNTKKLKASTPQGTGKVAKTNTNPLTMSDEELLASLR